MRFSRARWLKVTAGIVASAVVIAACSADEDTSGDTPDGGSDALVTPRSPDADGAEADAADDAARNSEDAGDDVSISDADASVPDAGDNAGNSDDAGESGDAGDSGDAGGVRPTCGTQPAPVFTSVTPNPLPYARSVEMTLHGSSFTPCSVAYVVRGPSNAGWPVATTYISSTELQAEWPALTSTMAGAGSTYVAVENHPDGVPVTTISPDVPTNSAWIFVPVRPVAVIASSQPTTALAGGATFTLALHAASYFYTGATVTWNGTTLADVAFTGPYGFDRWANVSATVPASLIASPGTAKIVVTNPGMTPSPEFDFVVR